MNLSESDPVVDALTTAILALDADEVRRLLDAEGIAGNSTVEGMPLTRMAIDAENEAGLNDPVHRVRGDVLALLLDRGGDPRAIYLDADDFESVSAPGLAPLKALLDAWAQENG